eukprot:366203-Chlamydomonas_euryale.AAC.20
MGTLPDPAAAAAAATATRFEQLLSPSRRASFPELPQDPLEGVELAAASVWASAQRGHRVWRVGLGGFRLGWVGFGCVWGARGKHVFGGQGANMCLGGKGQTC